MRSILDYFNGKEARKQVADVKVVTDAEIGSGLHLVYTYESKVEDAGETDDHRKMTKSMDQV